MGKGKGKTGKTNICVVGSIVGTDDYSWGTSGSVAHYWSYANKMTEEQSCSNCKCTYKCLRLHVYTKPHL